MRKEEFIGIIWGSGFVAQLVRALPCHGRGREFESRRIRQNKALRAIFCGLKNKAWWNLGGGEFLDAVLIF